MAIENGVVVTVDRVEATVKQIAELTRTQVLVGVPAATTGRRGDPITNAGIAYIQENGSPAHNIPPRPFLHPAVNAMQDEAAAMLRQAAEFQLDGDPGKAALVYDALGLKAQAAVKMKITTGPFTPLSPRTVAARARRGIMSDKPLVDSGQLLASISYAVRKS